MTLDKRLATVKDYLQIKALIADGKRQMITNGIIQWTNVYPSSGTVLKDITEQQLWIYGHPIYGCVTLTTSDCSLLIQRLVVHSCYQRKGIARMILKDIITKEKIRPTVHNIKLITNHSNFPMQNLVKDLGFHSKRAYIIPGREHFGDFIEFIYPLY